MKPLVASIRPRFDTRLPVVALALALVGCDEPRNWGLMDGGRRPDTGLLFDASASDADAMTVDADAAEDAPLSGLVRRRSVVRVERVDQSGVVFAQFYGPQAPEVTGFEEASIGACRLTTVRNWLAALFQDAGRMTARTPAGTWFGDFSARTPGYGFGLDAYVWRAGDEIEVSASGAAVLPFTERLTVPSSVDVTEPRATPGGRLTIAASMGLEVRWSTSAAPDVEIEVGGEWNGGMTRALVCYVPASQGSARLDPPMLSPFVGARATTLRVAAAQHLERHYADRVVDFVTVDARYQFPLLVEAR